MKKTILKIILGTTAVLLISLFALPQTAEAKSHSVGSIVKYEKRPTVYYVASDGYAYPFPDEATYKSWYSDFSTVITISNEDMASLTLGSNVTYKPGERMVKIPSVPKTYAVEINGGLRWVQTEEVAKALYGDNWNTMIDDLSEAFLPDYTIGDDIDEASDYDVEATKASAETIDDNL